MRRRVIYLVALAMVLSMAGDTWAELIGRWRLDEGAGTTAFDSSGNGHDGTLYGGVQWAKGLYGGALAFSGQAGDRVEVPSASLGGDFAFEGEITWAVWIMNSITAGPTTVMLMAPPGSAHISGNKGMTIEADGTIRLRAHSVGAANNYNSAIPVNDDEWHHIAMVLEFDTNGANDTMRFYVDGSLDNGYTTNAVDYNAQGNPADRILIFGDCTGWSPYNGLLDDVRVYNHALSEIEIVSAMTAKPWPYAFGPSPADGAVYTNTWVNLMWQPGEPAVSHDVYLGDNFEDVNAGTVDTFRGNQTTTSLLAGFPGYPYPGGLVPGTTYYWRIDEVNDADPNSPWKGDIWSFSIPPKKAYKPQPADEVKFVPADTTLTWTAGLGAKLHYVYFGDNFDDVNNASVGLAITTTDFTPAGPLELGKTYYWRVDEFDGTATYRGDVWSFQTIPVVDIADPNLVLSWTLDEGMGTTAVDWSGHGHHGTIMGGAQWVDGYQGTALSFADDIYVESDYTGVTGTAARTCCAWIKSSTANRNIMSWGQNVATQKWRMRIDATGGLRAENNGGYLYGVTNLADGRWHHVAVVLPDDGSPDILDALLYVDGQLDIIAASLANALDTAAGQLRIGESPWHNAPFVGVIDEARVYDKALTQEEVGLAMRIDPFLAWAPSPAEDSAPDIEHATRLTWSPGDKASQHEVYFGMDKAALANADASDTTGIYRGRQNATSYTPPEGVEWGGGPYFWRIDETNTDDTVAKGRIWSFTVADYLVVDDIESYNDLPESDPASNRIYMSWIDGFGTTTNGAFVGNLNVPLTEHSNVHSGAQAMPLSYDNNFKFSEATLTLTAGNDWTRQGVADLSLWFRGVAANAPEPMYVALNGTAAVYHDDPNAVQATNWTEWDIPLQAFTDQGVNLANVTSLAIGFGTPGNTNLPGGTGQMFFDDIRLYRPEDL